MIREAAGVGVVLVNDEATLVTEQSVEDMSEALRREIHDGLNVVEQWNGATDFVFFARRGEMVSNRREDHEVSMLALHLMQNCMVYINTLMIQKLLAQPHWQGKLTPRDYVALTPLIWEHVNPYGRFDLDMNTRSALL